MRNAGMASWAGAFLSRKNRVQVAGELLFRIEGQCLNRRASGLLSDKLRERWHWECSGLSRDALEYGLIALKDAMPELNSFRVEVVRESVA